MKGSVNDILCDNIKMYNIIICINYELNVNVNDNNDSCVIK